MQLASLAGRGDAGAFEVFHARHRASLLAFCRRLLGSRDDGEYGEDALQLTILRACRAPGETGSFPHHHPHAGKDADMFTRILLLTALAAALAVAPAQAGVTDPTRAPRAACLVVDQDLGQPDMARDLVFSGDAYDNEMGVTRAPRSGRLR